MRWHLNGSPGRHVGVGLVISVALVCAVLSCTYGADSTQWGQALTRNMVSTETGLPDGFDPVTGSNVAWVAELGTQSYCTPVVAGGRVFVGTNNDRPRDPRHEGDRGILLCLDERDGALRWQLVIPKLTDDRYKDWPRVGICSPPSVEGRRVYAVSSRAEVLCLDIDGLANGNDGPFVDEARLMTPDELAPIPLRDKAADVLWRFDMVAEAGVYPHDSAHSSILIDGPYLYLNTGNGVDNTHRKIRSPDAPSLIVLDKQTGRLVARDREGIAPRVFHATWSSPSLGTVEGERRVFFGGADGVCYAFEALPPRVPSSDSPVAALRRLWSFDCDPNAPKENVHAWVGNRKEGPSIIKGMPVFHEGRVYVTAGGDIWWGKHEARLFCLDARGTGDVTRTGCVWSHPMNRHCCSTPSVHGGLVYVADCGGTLHCLDAATGQSCWTHDIHGQAWGSTLVADGNVYVGTLNGRFWVLAEGREKRVLADIKLGAPTSATPVAANGTLFVSTYKRLFAIRAGAGGGANTVSQGRVER